MIIIIECLLHTEWKGGGGAASVLSEACALCLQTFVFFFPFHPFLDVDDAGDRNCTEIMQNVFIMVWLPCIVASLIKNTYYDALIFFFCSFACVLLQLLYFANLLSKNRPAC